MQFVSKLSNGRVELGPGTIYGAIKTMVKRKWIEPLDGSIEIKLSKRGYKIMTCPP